MAKGDDAVRRKKKKINRKKLRNSESSVSARIAAIIASKRRRKAGKRRSCEGMCFSLPTPEDPFNDRHDKKRKEPQQTPPPILPRGTCQKQKDTRTTPISGAGNLEDGCFSKFLILCLNAIQSGCEEGEDSRKQNLLACSSWGAELWRRCSAGWNVVDSSGCSASRDQLAWLLSTASDIITRREKQGHVVATPFLLFLVPSQHKALQVRSICKPLKALGVHTVSLHPGASLDHQIQGLKSCEPEFLVSTPERLLELVSLQAIDISGISLLVLDGLKNLVDLGFFDKVKSIREKICGEPQIVVFSDCYEEVSASLVRCLLKGPVCKLSLDDSVASQSAFISQHIHLYTSEEEKILKALQIVTQAFADQKLPQHLKVLLIAGSTSNVKRTASRLEAEGYAISDDSLIDGVHVANGEKIKAVSVKDIESIQRTGVEEFEIVIFLEFPPIEDYIGILTKSARYSIAGAVHCFFSKENTPLAQPLIKFLEKCGQTVPENLKVF